MRLNKLATLSALLAGFFIFPYKAFADVSVQGSKSTPIEIEVVPRTLFLASVTPPTFGEYEISGDVLSFSANSDLVINVEDTSDTSENHWVLYYELGVFTNESGSPIPSQQVNIGTGTMKVDGELLDDTQYESYSLSSGVSAMSSLVKVDSGVHKQFEYRVLKENISLDLSGELEEGIYTGTQSIFLASVPDNS